jgi:AcrR family transcriptional regulator
MSSASSADLTARARVRDAAIACFGQRGFGVPVRAIADHAGVSPGLVIHHFGSKEKLRGACDDHVRGVINELRTEALRSPGGAAFMHHLTALDLFAPILGYLLQSLRAGGPLAVSVFELMVEETERYLAAGEETGLIRPSRDPAGRARWAVSTGLGSLLLHANLRHPGADADYQQVLQTWMAEHTLAALEAYSEPILADTSWLDAYTAVQDPGSAPAPPETCPNPGAPASPDADEA